MKSSTRVTQLVSRRYARMKEVRVRMGAMERSLNELVHVMISGTTGSGKSVGLNSLIYNLVTEYDASEVKLVMIDPKKVELSMWNGIPHLMAPVISDMRMAQGILNYIVNLMEERYADMAVRHCKEWDGFQIVVVIDELADLIITDRKAIETSLVRIAQKARASGIHLVLATQRPSAEVLTGLIRANMPTKIAFRVANGTDSRIAIGRSGAEKIEGVGNAIIVDAKGKEERFRTTMLEDSTIIEEVKKLRGMTV